MARYVPDGSSGSGSGPNVVLLDDVGMKDTTSLGFTLPDDIGFSDGHSLGMTFSDDVGLKDSITVTSSATIVDDIGFSDSCAFTNVWTATARSGSPDSDPWGDAWTDATVGATGTNHGNVTPVLTSNVTSATEARSFFEIDLTRFTGMTGTGNVHTLALWCSCNNPTAANTVTAHFGAQASRWFTESTITQANQPATPSLFTKTFSANANTGTSGTAQAVTLTLSDSDLNALLGKWVLIVFTVALATAGSVCTASREDATHQMVLTFTGKV